MISELIEKRRNGAKAAIYSCCSANEDVLRAAMLRAKSTGGVLLVEATSNQVNQFGGYTGKTPEKFARLVLNLATEIGLPKEQLLLGGDHLGPLVWCDLPEERAMQLAEELVRSYVAAGFCKIHLDTSMRVASDDPNAPFSTSICAERGALLCRACEDEFSLYLKKHPEAKAPWYVIGSEVPVPGGEVGNDPSSAVTTVADYGIMINAYNAAFEEFEMKDVFKRIAAIVVEMGVEFSEYRVSRYNRTTFAPLAHHIAENDIRIGFEAHSTDFQTRLSLSQMIEDGAVFLKVGPALTFAARSALFKLELIERELVKKDRWSHYREVLDKAMLEYPAKWESYYHGSASEIAFARAFSFSDRCRYYCDMPSVRNAHDQLLDNLSGIDLPECLLFGLFPKQYDRVVRGVLDAEARSVLYDSIGDVVDDYLYSTNNNRLC